ncbi:polynucleotide adenylyltransferase PcnB [Wohlfahrtiimonas chitiniclastica]|uniref:polynucleotide adenylyltransferase PcnB n=1 Tax=Wohlfahrtiimonas chitiniclastica TaxID=400946 RepID=UPI001BCDA101|nr:polynucleotide adenylyltransferase PcnB [Wohlfahrtiimonas chitiniclastica]
MNKKIYTAQEHGLTRRFISKQALSVVQTLVDAGYEAYIVGGAVRDILLKKSPKDFDIATNAHPEQIKRLFRNCRLVGRRFRLAHILFGRDIIEVATFRANSDDDEEHKDRKVGDDGFLIRDNVYGTIEDDAVRRDFTINALYYDPIRNEVIDFTNGYEDLLQGQLTLIGDPAKRFREDPVRMLRAVRFEVKLGFTMPETLINAINDMGYLLQTVSAARMFDEVVKLMLNGYGHQVYLRLRHYHLFSQIFPQTERALIELGNPEDHLLIAALHNSDNRINDGFGASTYFLYSALLWEPFLDEYHVLLADDIAPNEASTIAADKIIRKQQEFTMIPKRISAQMTDLWKFQFRLTHVKARKNRGGVNKILHHPRFKAAFDFLLLRKDAFESSDIVDHADFWQKAWDSHQPE